MSENKKNEGSIKWGDSVEAIIATLNPAQKLSLLGRYIDSNPEYAKQFDEILNRFANSDHHIMLEFKSELEKEGKGKFTLGNKSAKEITSERLSTMVNLEYKKFWKMEHETPNSAKPDINIKRLASYVPKLVQRRLVTNAQNIKVPEMEKFSACVMFADISGFTPLTERFASEGSEGVEKLTAVLNDYFDKFIKIIYEYGGDIVKFAGDALLVVWPTTSKSGLEAMVILGCQSAKKLLEDLNDYSVKGTDLKLTLHIGIGAGEVGGVYVGGAKDVDFADKDGKNIGLERIEYFISGDVLEQVSSCEKQAQPGECYISEFAMERISHLNALETRQKGKGGFENHKLVDIKIWAPAPPQLEFPLTAENARAIKSYINLGVLRHIDGGTRKWMAELRKISVLFVNLTNPFKESKLDQLQAAVKGMQEIVYSLEGTVRQFMIDDKGSVFIASYGVPPLSHEDDIIRAIEAALSIKHLLEHLGVAHSIGATTGMAFCGDVGTETRREYAMVGDIVNLSARLMAAAMSRKGLLIDSESYNGAKNSPTLAFEKQEPFKVKGKQHPITTYIPVKVKKRVTDNASPIVNIIGREKEIEQLQNLAQQVIAQKTKSPKILIIEGEVGVGKTILVNKLQTSFKEANKLCFIGNGDQLKSTSQYHAFVDMFEAMVSNGELLPEYSALLQSEKNLVPLLKSVLNITRFEKKEIEESDTTRAMSNQVKSKETQRLLLLLLNKLMKPGSLIIFENAHWLDSGSWSLALALSHDIKCSILISIVLRPILEKSNFSYTQMLHGHQTIHLPLGNLSEEDTTDLITQCVQADLIRLNRLDINVKKIPTKISQSIFSKSNGNPYSTVELVSALLESGILSVSKSGQCIMSNETWSDKIPHTLTGLLTSKVDKLSPSQQLIIKVASCIRGEFPFDMLFEILINQNSGGQTTTLVIFKEEDLKKDLRTIQSAGLIQIETTEPESYVFSNPLIADVVYELMLHKQRRNIHENIASYYSTHYPGNSHYYGLLAYHYKQAALDAKAFESFQMAGKSCLNLYINREAISFFSEALQLFSKIEDPNSASLERVSLERKLGQAYFNLGRFIKASEHFISSLALLDLPYKDLSKLIKKKYDGFLFYHGRPKKDELENIKQDKMHRKREAVICILALAKIAYYTCKKQEAILCSNLGYILCEGTGSVLESEVASVSALTSSINGEINKAEEYLTKAKDLSNNQLDALKITDEVAGIVYCGTNNFTKAQEAFTKAIESAKIVGDLKYYEECSIYLATVYEFQGQFKKSLEILTEIIDSARRRGDSHSIIMATNAQARNYYFQGNFNSCIDSLEDVQIGLDSGDNNDAAISINYHALQALLSLRKFKPVEKEKEKEKEGNSKDKNTDSNLENIHQYWIFAEEVYSSLINFEPTRFDLFFAFTWLLEGYARLSQEPTLLTHLSDLKVTKSKVQERVKKTMKYLEKFSSLFVFAEPRLYMWKGYFNFISSNLNKAKTNWAISLEKAKERNLKLEEAFTLYVRGKFTKNGEDSSAAIQFFPEIVNFDADLTKQNLRQRMKTHSPSLANFFADNALSTSPTMKQRGTLKSTSPKGSTINGSAPNSESAQSGNSTTNKQ